MDDIENQLDDSRENTEQQQHAPPAAPPPSLYQMVLYALGSWLIMYMNNIRFVTNVYPHNPEIQATMIQNLQFVSGVSTLLQTILGIRLPVVMTGSINLLRVVLAIDTDEANHDPSNAHMVLHRWEGVLLLSGIFLSVISILAIWQRAMRFLTPLVLIPFSMCYILAGRSGRLSGVDECPQIAIPMFLIFTIIFSKLYLKGKEHFSIFITVSIAWIGIIIYSLIRKADHCGHWHSDIMENTHWITTPAFYRWGAIQLRPIDILHAFLVSSTLLVQSTLGYILLARQIGVDPPPLFAINRSIGLQGLGMLLSSIFGAGFGTCVSLEHIGFLSIARVQQRQTRIIQLSALLAIFFSMFGKITSFITTIPRIVIVVTILIILGFGGFQNFSAYRNMRSRDIAVVIMASLCGIRLPDVISAYDWTILDRYPFLYIILESKEFVGVVCTIILDIVHFGHASTHYYPYWPRIQAEEDDRGNRNGYSISRGMERVLSSDFWEPVFE